MGLLQYTLMKAINLRNIYPVLEPYGAISTLNQGYPLPQYKDTALRTAPRPHHMGRFRGTMWQGKIIHPRVHYRVRTPRRNTGPLYAQPEPLITVRGSQKGMPDPSVGPQVPPSKVWITTRTRDGANPGMSKGPALARVQALPYAPRSGGDPLLLRGL
jgi:hypothetical protein